jgi:excisionase family DNA binding protein
MKQKTAPDVLTAGELAKLMRVHPFTVTRLARQGRIKGAFRMGGVWRFPTRKILEWMQSGGDVGARLDGRRGKRTRRSTRNRQGNV